MFFCPSCNKKLEIGKCECSSFSIDKISNQYYRLNESSKRNLQIDYESNYEKIANDDLTSSIVNPNYLEKKTG